MFVLDESTLEEDIKKLLCWFVIEHDRLLLAVEDKKALVHAMKKLDVFLIRKLKLSVQLRDVYDNHTEHAGRHEHKQDYDYIHDNLAERHLQLVHGHTWEEEEEG